MKGKKLTDRLSLIATAGLGVAGLIFVLLSIFDAPRSAWTLPVGLACVALGGLFNVARMLHGRDKGE